MYDATRLASPARTRANQITHASEVPTSPEYSRLATNAPVHEISPSGSTRTPRAVRTTPPVRNITATAQRVETRASYFLKYTVPSAQESAEVVPKTTPAGEMAFPAPEILPALIFRGCKKPRHTIPRRIHRRACLYKLCTITQATPVSWGFCCY